MSQTNPTTAKFAMDNLRIPSYRLYTPEGFQQLTDTLANRIAATNNAIAAVHTLSSTQARGHEGSRRVGWKLKLHRLQIKGRYEDSRSEDRHAELEELNEINHHLVSLRKLLSRMKDGEGNRDEAAGSIRNMYANLEPGERWGTRPRELLVKRIWNPIMDENSADEGYKVENQIASISNTSLGSCFDAVPREETSIANENGSINAGSSVQTDEAPTRSGRSRGSSRASSRSSSVFSMASSHSSIASSIHSWISGLRK